MDIPTDIFRKNKKKRLDIPKTIFVNNQDIPEKVVIKYKNKIDTDKLDEIVSHRLKMLKKDSDYEDYKKIKEQLLKNISEDQNRNNIQKFLDLCNKYIKIECIKTIDNILKCRGCDKCLESDEEIEDNTYVCNDCECINTFLKPNHYSKTSDKFPSSEDDTNNFIKVLDKFEGRNEPYPPEHIYEQLDAYFISMKMKPGEYYRELPLNSKGKKDGTSKKKLWDALENTGNNKYYDESNFITHKYWGWKLPDITLYREKLISDYQETQNVWNKIKSRYNRSASLGTQFRLYVHLKAIDYNCEREDFKIQDMVESLRIHNDAWKKMCEETGLKYVFVS